MKSKFLIALSMLTLTAPAFAEGPGSPASFGDLDANQDGVISRTEAGQDESLAGTFEIADMNKDGNIDQAEFAKQMSDETAG